MIYHEAFGEKGAKPEKVIRNMFHKQMCYFHIAQNESECYAIALSGKLKGTKLLLIDYLAVREKDQNKRNWSNDGRLYKKVGHNES